MEGTDVGVWIENVRQTPVCFSHLFDTVGREAMPREPGVVHCTVRLPGHFLVPDTYALTLKVHVPNVESLDTRRDVLRFTVVETGSTAARYAQAYRSGCVFGDFRWSIDSVPEDMEGKGT